MKREELAWAAGFWDGEGCIHFGLQIRKPPRRPTTNRRVIASVSQVDRRVLDRFASLFSFGRVSYHPRPNGSLSKRDGYWRWQTCSFETVQALVAMLWPWLDAAKRDQATTALKGYRTGGSGLLRGSNQYTVRRTT